MRRWARACASVLALVAAPVAAQSAGQWQGPDQVWRSSCGYCHGAGVGPEIRGRRIDPATLTAILRAGLPGMPAFHPSELDDRDVAGLATWLSRPPHPKPR